MSLRTLYDVPEPSALLRRREEEEEQRRKDTLPQLQAENPRGYAFRNDGRIVMLEVFKIPIQFKAA